MPIARVRDAQIYYEWTGDEHRPVVLFCNSLGTNLHMWDGQVEAFAKYFRVLRYDTRGHGKSSVTPGPYTIEQLGEDVIELLDALKLDRVYFCGLSMGGSTGMYLGANKPQRFHKIVLCNTSPRFGNADTWRARIRAVQGGGMKSVAGGVIERWLTPRFRAAHSDETQMVLTMLESTNPQGYISNCEAVRDADMRALLANIRVPCLVVAGTHDQSATTGDGRTLAESIPGAQYIELSAAHLSNIEAREEFNRCLLQFLLA
jgi:3-oxoadipate enol-lactonase